MTDTDSNFYVTTGGVLPNNAPSYVPRQADTDLYNALKQREFCYVLNSRQMGKSSLMQRVAEQLRNEEITVVTLDLMAIGTNLNVAQWYNGLLNKIGRNLGLNKELREFVQAHQDLSPLQRWQDAIRDVVLVHCQQPLVIFFDEIDLVRSLPFSADEFFAAIRECYEARSQDTDLERLTFCLIGAAKPADLINKPDIFSFGIGQAIELTGFQWQEAQLLADGLKTKTTNPTVALRAVLNWTGGQPFLTQKVCHFIQQIDSPIPTGQEVASIEQLVQTKIIASWEEPDHPQHLQTIRDRLVGAHRDSRQTWRLLGLCQHILSTTEFGSTKRSAAALCTCSADDEMELRLTGLMVKRQGQLRFFNKIYEKVFNQDWIREQFKNTTGPNPYKGLSAFQPEDVERFFGRTQLTAALLEKFCDLYTARSPRPRLLPILGPSGSGKSSVARAGLMPALTQRLLPGLDAIQVKIITPTELPLKVLAGVLVQRNPISPRNLISQEQRNPISPRNLISQELQEIEELLRNKPDALKNLVATLPDIDTAPLVILIDQFEEIYTLCQQAEERTAFIENIMAAVQDDSRRLSVILTLRSDFLAETQRHEAFNQAIAHQAVIVLMMSEAELRDAMSQPAENAGHPLETSTVALLLEQTKGREGALPLLQFALTRLWEGLSNGITPADTLTEIGGVGGALAQAAERIYQGLSDTEQQIARRAFLKLIQLGEGSKDTRRRVNMADMVAHREAPENIHGVLEHFVRREARLITLSKDEHDQVTAEVTHEALLENWATLKEWLASSREDLRFEHRLADAAKHWDSQSQVDGLLWRSPDLELLRNFHQHASQDMTAVQVAFFQASARKQRQTKWWNFGAMLLVVLTFISGASTYWAFSERENAQQAREEVLRIQSLFFAKLAQRATEKDSVTDGILLALEALPKNMSAPNKPLVVEAEEALKKAISQHRERLVLQVNEPMTHAVFSPDGKQLVTTGSKGSLYFWNVASGKLLSFVYGHTDKVSHVAFSYDGKFLVTASDDNTAYLWNSSNGKRLSVFNHTNKVSQANFSADGKRVLTVSGNGAHLWGTLSSKRLSTLGHNKNIYQAAFSPNGKFVVTVSIGTAKLWNSFNGERLSILKHKNAVYHAVFSSNSEQLLTVSKDDIRLWEVSSNKLLLTLDSDNLERDSDYGFSTINFAAFSLDGKQIITNYKKDGIALWEASSGKHLSFYHSDMLRFEV
ncbi:MAG: hypothetical protein DRR19_25630 [Candidatus Parabeggiatoa sp. nov. 1]|nr:MAG: hypothetical protein DRR19_25630 [Gammaproteobacteria bacterium]